jgi:hypothetical protein
MAMIVPNMLLMGWVSYFFDGFVMLKLPFALSVRFKTMLQRGINISSLNVSYVSALSFYFICAFGLRGVNTVLMGNNNAGDPMAAMKAQQKMAMGGMGGPAAPDMGALSAAERTELEITAHDYCVGAAEERLLTLLASQ